MKQIVHLEWFDVRPNQLHKNDVSDTLGTCPPPQDANGKNEGSWEGSYTWIHPVSSY